MASGARKDAMASHAAPLLRWMCTTPGSMVPKGAPAIKVSPERTKLAPTVIAKEAVSVCTLPSCMGVVLDCISRDSER